MRLRIPNSKFRTGITLIEILISMFVLLFGLMGVAAIFPVASHYLVQGDQKDRSDQLANNAFAEIEARGMMDSDRWLYGDIAPSGPSNAFFIIPETTLPPPVQKTFGYFNMPLVSPVGDEVYNPGPGHAFVIDPMGAAAATAGTIPGADLFPYGAVNIDPTVNNPWNPTPSGASFGATGTRFPVRRMTLSVIDPASGFAPPFNIKYIDTPTAETIFRLRDDLAVELPDQGDRPAMQRWSVYNNGTPNNLTDDTLLSRQYQGDYSWLATVVPVDNNALLGLQPAANLDGGLYDVSVVVFYKRDIVPSASASGSPGSERLIAAEFLNQGELLIYDANSNDPDVVDAAVDGLRATNWICVMGVNQINGQFMMKWYRILAMDEDSEDMQYSPAGITGNAIGRTLMVSEGGAWPSDSWQNLQVAILPGAIHVQTRQMPLSCECCQ